MARPQFVDPRAPRLNAAATVVVLAVALLTRNVWLLGVQAVLFALGAAGSSPYQLVFRQFVAPRLRPPAELEAAAPVRFAQAVGLVFTLVAIAGFAGGIDVLGLAAVAAALAAAFLNAAFGFCLGCELYLLAVRAAGRPLSRTTRPSPTTTR